MLSSVDGRLRKEAGGRNPTTRRHGAHGVFQSSFSPEAPYPLGAVAVVSLQEDPPGSGGCGPGQRGTGSQVHGAGLTGRHTLPSSVSPMTVHPWETSLPRLQGRDSSPGHYGLNGIESAAFVVYSVFILSFELCFHSKFVSFFLMVYVVLILSGRGSLYVLEMNSLWVSPFANIFSYAECFIFYFLWYSSAFKFNPFFWFVVYFSLF